jgi:uncharacterized membrane protein
MEKKFMFTMALALTLFSASALQAAQDAPASGRNLGSVTGGNFKKAQLVIEKRCTSCHTAKVIEDAFAAGKNMLEIQHRMEQKGVRLSADEHSVLGIFWKQTPLKKSK